MELPFAEILTILISLAIISKVVLLRVVRRLDGFQRIIKRQPVYLVSDLRR